MAADTAVVLDTPVELKRVPLVQNQRSLRWITDNVSDIVESRTPIWWWLAFLPCALLAGIGLFGALL